MKITVADFIDAAEFNESQAQQTDDSEAGLRLRLFKRTCARIFRSAAAREVSERSLMTAIRICIFLLQRNRQRGRLPPRHVARAKPHSEDGAPEAA